MPPAKGMCQHCGKSAITRSRRLCWRCYYTGDILTQYTPNPRGGLQSNNHRTPPDDSTQARPSTLDKEMILAFRESKGQQLWHPNDAGWGDDLS